MVELATATDAEWEEDEPEERELGDVTVLTRDLHVHYRVHTDRRPTLQEVIARRGRRPGYQEVKAVQGVDLIARQGEAIGLIGRNGSGKSTLLQAIAGLLPASEGEVYARSQPALLGVSAALQPSVSGRRNIILGGLALGLSRQEIEARVDEIVEWTGLEEFVDLPLRTYSSGMRARLHFAISTAVEPEILLVDEALSVGDEVFKERSKERVGELLDNAGTVFICSHSMSTIRDMCTRVIWLEAGRVEMDGDAKDVVKAYKRHYQLSSKKKKKKKKKKKQQQAAAQQVAEEQVADAQAAEAAALTGTGEAPAGAGEGSIAADDGSAGAGDGPARPADAPSTASDAPTQDGDAPAEGGDKPAAAPDHDHAEGPRR